MIDRDRPCGAAHAPPPSVGERPLKRLKALQRISAGFGVGFSGLCPPFPLPRSGGAVCSLAQRIDQLSGLWPGILGKGSSAPQGR
uniref:Uncharacterized protein n=1 Tax=Kingella kingae KKC2005004457 TaxID=1229911 RepID=T0KVU5_KINKI|nr:hypothetical protein C297_p00140 [Kingella kingae KKC2005004457]